MDTDTDRSPVTAAHTTTTTAPEAAAVPTALRPRAELPAPVRPLGTLVPVVLHWFQKEAVAAAVRAVKDGGRAPAVLATGSGKTLIAAACARRLAAKGRVLVLVQTIELLEQTAASWSTLGGRRGLAVAACSREEALESAEAGGRIHAQVTTVAARIADLVANVKPGEPVTVNPRHPARPTQGAERVGPESEQRQDAGAAFGELVTAGQA